MTQANMLLAMKLLAVCYTTWLSLAVASVVSCEARSKGSCNENWNQAYSVVAGAVSSLWAYTTDSPIQQGAKGPGRPRKTDEPTS